MEMDNNIEIKKAKIRERYKGINSSEFEIIPALPPQNLYDDNKEMRVAAYARVSTIDINQTTSYELQKNHYVDLINRHKGWRLVDIYADEGISGTSLNHRDSFIKMIEDCKNGKIDLIVTKSVSRFARNTLDCLEYVRELRSLPNPVGILFETENIYTLDNRSEMALSFLATMAQEESHIKSDIMNASLEMRFSRGILLTPALLGYDKDENGNLIINEEEAKTVKLIFFMYLYGDTCQQIANLLTEYGRKTKKGNIKWSANSILQILQNERHCGDVLTRKTWTPNYLDHKSKKNKQNLEQRRWKDQHDAIISRDDFIAVQRLISNAKYGNKGFLPKLKVIPEGVLKGFVSINPRWAAFKAEDYINAAMSIDVEPSENIENIELEANTGDFDLRKFEVARSQFFDIIHKICVTFSNSSILFNTDCVRKFDKVLYVEMLINPMNKLLAVRPCDKDCRNAIKWAKITQNGYYSRSISATAYIKTLYKLLGWNTSYKYRIRGLKKEKGNEPLLIFDLSETEVFISQENEKNDLEPISENVKLFTAGPKKDIMAFPYSWADSFGNNYYRQAQINELLILNAKEWKINMEGIAYNSEELNTTTVEELQNGIETLKANMKQETINE
jgi:site-specific DNA recombinase